MLARLSEAEHQLPQQPCQRDSKHQNPVGRASKTITTWPKQTAAETGLLQRTLLGCFPLDVAEGEDEPAKLTKLTCQNIQ